MLRPFFGYGPMLGSSARVEIIFNQLKIKLFKNASLHLRIYIFLGSHIDMLEEELKFTGALSAEQAREESVIISTHDFNSDYVSNLNTEQPQNTNIIPTETPPLLTSSTPDKPRTCPACSSGNSY